MVKRPPDLDPENFVLGQGWYAQRRSAVPYADDSQFRFDPAPIPPFPWLMLLVLNTVYMLFFGSFIWFAQTHRDPAVSRLTVNILITAIGLMTCGCTVGSVMLGRWFGAREIALGPSLVYEKSTRRVSLPRLHLDFDFTEVVHLQYVSTGLLQDPRSALSPPHPVSELNMVTIRDGKRQRRNVLKSSDPIGAFEYLLDPLVEQTDIPVVHMTETAGNWKVWIRPFHDPIKPARA
jgi:hypothetical protein